MKKNSAENYHSPEKIDELIKNALKPVVERKLKDSRNKESLLAVKVCDPACGSGARRFCGSDPRS